jgi:hypothetical protein
MFTVWMKSALEASRLCQEMQEVIAMRMITLSRGGSAAHREAQRMVTEKGAAFAEASLSLMTGASMKKVARRYRSLVRANRRRLSK